MVVEYDPDLVPERPLRVDCRGRVGAVPGYIGMFRHPRTGEPEPAMTYEIRVTLDNEPCDCVMADETAGEVLAIINGDPGSLLYKSGNVRIYWEPLV